MPFKAIKNLSVACSLAHSGHALLSALGDVERNFVLRLYGTIPDCGNYLAYLHVQPDRSVSTLPQTERSKLECFEFLGSFDSVYSAMVSRSRRHKKVQSAGLGMGTLNSL